MKTTNNKVIITLPKNKLIVTKKISDKQKMTRALNFLCPGRIKGLQNPISWLEVPKSKVKFTNEAFRREDLEVLWKQYKKFILMNKNDKDFIFAPNTKTRATGRFNLLQKFFKTKLDFTYQNAEYLIEKNVFIHFWCECMDNLGNPEKNIIYLPLVSVVIIFYETIINPKKK